MATKITKCKCGIEIKTISFKKKGKTLRFVEKDFCSCELIKKKIMENVINSDPTLKTIINNEIDYKMFGWHLELKCAALKIALRKYIH